MAGAYLAADSGTVMKKLEQFLLARAMEHDSPTLLFNWRGSIGWLARWSGRSPIVLARMIGAARKAASDLTSHLLAPVPTDELRADLERMLLVDAGLGMI